MSFFRAKQNITEKEINNLPEIIIAKNSAIKYDSLVLKGDSYEEPDGFFHDKYGNYVRVFQNTEFTTIKFRYSKKTYRRVFNIITDRITLEDVCLELINDVVRKNYFKEINNKIY
jgi:hypothetical protein